MTGRYRFIPYRRDLKRRSQSLRRDPSPQKPLGRYIADFYCSSRKLVIELDGDSHFNDAGQRYDEARTAALEVEGVRVLRFTNADVMQDFEGVCLRIQNALTRVP